MAADSSSNTIEIMVNECFGGFGFSKDAIKEYLKRSSAEPNNPELMTGNDGQAINEYNVQRHNPVMVQIVKEMGFRANGAFAEIHLKKIPSQYIKHYSIEEYDGRESVVIQYDKYKVDSAKMLLKSSHLSKEQKLAQISALLHAQLEKACTYAGSISDPEWCLDDDQ